MARIALRAHSDGERIVLDEPFDLPAHASLLVTLLPHGSGREQPEDEEIWHRAIISSDAFTFLADPAEDIYTADDGEPFHDAI